MATPGKPSPTELLAQNLKALCQAKGWSGNELSKRSKVPQKTVSIYMEPSQRKPTLTGKEASPNMTHMSKLAAAFGIPEWQLIYPATATEHQALELIRQMSRGG